MDSIHSQERPSNHRPAWIFQIFLCFFSYFAHADPANPKSPCTRVCSPDEIEYVSVQFAAETEKSPAYFPSDRAFHKIAPGTKDLGIVFVSDSLIDLPKRIATLANSCKRIKGLDFMSHGRQGAGYMQENDPLPFDLITLDVSWAGLDCAMAPNAEVRFGGCNIGKGCRGEDFLMGVAQRLLTKGGSVEGATDYTYSAKYLPVAPISPFGWQRLDMSPNLGNPKWRHPRSLSRNASLASPNCAADSWKSIISSRAARKLKWRRHIENLNQTL